MQAAFGFVCIMWVADVGTGYCFRGIRLAVVRVLQRADTVVCPVMLQQRAAMR